MGIEEIKTILKGKVNYVDNVGSDEIINNFVEQLLDIKIDKVYPLNELDTLYIRKYLMIINEELSWSQRVRIDNYVFIVLGEFFSNNITLNSSIYALLLSNRISNVLLRNNIYTIMDLVKYSKYDLKKMYFFGPETVKKIEERINELGFHLGMNFNSNFIKNDIRMLNLKNRTYNVLKNYGINTIEELLNISYYTFNNTPFLGLACQTDILNKIHKLNIKMKFEEEKGLLKREIWEIFPTKLANILFHYDIYVIEDLIKYKISELEIIPYLSSYKDIIVNKIHSYGLYFQDEISEEMRLKNHNEYLEELGYIVDTSVSEQKERKIKTLVRFLLTL